MFDHILVSDLDGAIELVDELKQLGLAANCDTPLLPALSGGPNEAIWVGRNVDASVAITAIKTAVAHWLFLKYIHLSCDLEGYQPDSIHYQVFLGGATWSALQRSCRPWTSEDFQRLDCGMSRPDFHRYVRNFYDGPPTPNELETVAMPESLGVTTLVGFLGGPQDWQSASFAAPPEFVPRTLAFGRSQYHLQKVGDNYEYHLALATGEIH